MVWVGAGPLGRDDGKVLLFLRGQAAAAAAGWRATAAATGPTDPEHDRIREVLARRGACFFRELAGADDKASLDALWDLVWAGEVTNDSFAALRAFVAGGAGSRADAPGKRQQAAPARARSPCSARPRPRAGGRWWRPSCPLGDVTAHRAAPRPGRPPCSTATACSPGRRCGARATPGGFAGVYPVLRAMEESGRARRGYFVAGLGGAQFALPGRGRPAAGPPGGHRRGRSSWPPPTRPTPTGVSLPVAASPVPGRVAGAYVVLVDGLASLYVEKGAKALVALRPFDGTWEDAAVGALDGLVASGRVRRLAVERYDDALAPGPPRRRLRPVPEGPRPLCLTSANW